MRSGRRGGRPCPPWDGTPNPTLGAKHVARGLVPRGGGDGDPACASPRPMAGRRPRIVTSEYRPGEKASETAKCAVLFGVLSSATMVGTSARRSTYPLLALSLPI